MSPVMMKASYMKILVNIFYLYLHPSHYNFLLYKERNLKMIYFEPHLFLGVVIGVASPLDGSVNGVWPGILKQPVQVRI